MKILHDFHYKKKTNTNISTVTNQKLYVSHHHSPFGDLILKAAIPFFSATSSTILSSSMTVNYFEKEKKQIKFCVVVLKTRNMIWNLFG